MVRVYHLDLRILITEKDGVFTVEPLEITGRVKASDKEKALQCLELCVQGTLAAGEPLWREPPQALLELWNGPHGRQKDGSTIRKMILKVRGRKESAPLETVDQNP